MRRIVASDDASAASLVVSDGEAPTFYEFGTTRATQLWRLTAADVPVPSTIDTTGDVPFGVDLEPGESRWVCIDFGPGADVARHASATVDLGYVVDGEITLVLDRDEVHLRAGDCLVQLGAHHGWRNDGAGACRMLFHVVSTAPAPS
jgi:quercetin dioxygenase-like cupin family protein